MKQVKQENLLCDGARLRKVNFLGGLVYSGSGTREEVSSMYDSTMAFSRLFLLGAMGLAALYMMHLLAQDYNKIRQPLAVIRSLLRSKREIEANRDENIRKFNGKEFDINWKRILRYDPMQCLQSLICQLTAGAESNDPDGRNIKDLIQFSLWKEPPLEIVSAVKTGLKYKGDHKKCFKEYPFCLYSASTMLKFLRIF